jgi:hypothetical protein
MTSQLKEGPMSSRRSALSSAIRSAGFAALILLPALVAACSNGGSGGY